MDNPQATQTEIAWLAGMLEGDGHIGMRFNKVSHKKYILVCVEFANTDKAIAEHIFDICSKLGARMRIKSCNLSNPKARRKTIYQVSTHRMKSAEPILRAVLPYLVGEKKQRCEPALKFIESRRASVEATVPGWNSYVPYTDDQIDQFVKCRHLITPWESSETIREELQAQL